MNDQLNKMLSICIFGKNCVSELKDCIRHATELTDKIFFVDLGSDDQSKSKASELSISIVDQSSFPSILKSEWILFMRPDERPIVSSTKKLVRRLRDKHVHGYGVYTKSSKVNNLLNNYQWIRKLEQFKGVGASAYVDKIEPRLVRKPLAKECIEGLVTGKKEDISWVCGKIVPGIVIKSIPDIEQDDAESPRDHDLRCLKGELIYDITPAEDMVELSEAYTGFRLVHRGQLAGFIEGAKQGFGNLKMYISMLDFLCKEGYFDQAKDLFETWIEHRPDNKEIYHTQTMGGVIYSNLLDVDKAITWFERNVKERESLSAMANLGKLYLIKGQKERAVEYLKKSKNIISDTFPERILSVIDRDEWQPLTLSLCMIVRDEETEIGKAMKSVEGIPDEIIVVDTGSSDGTIEIAKKFGGRIIETKWEDDFSKAKNIAIDEATGDYILFMDADEFIDSRHKFALALFKKILPIKKNIAFEIKVDPPEASRELGLSYLDRLLKNEEAGYQIRLFPRNPQVKFQGKTFETLDETLKSQHLRVARNDILKITHSMGGREKRDKRKMPVALKDFESIHDPQKTLEGGLLFLRLGDLDRAYPWLIKVKGMNPTLSAKIGMLYSRLDRPEMAKEIITEALEQFTESAQLILSLSEVYYKQGKYSEVVKVLEKEIEAVDKDLEPEEAVTARFYFGISLLETGDMTSGIEQIALAREKDPANICYKIAGIYAFSKVDQWEEALQVAGQIADEEGIDIPGEVNDFVDVGRIFMVMNRHFAQTGSIEEANLCQKIVEYVIKTKISGEVDIRTMSEVIEGVG